LLQDIAEHSKLVESIEAEIRPIRLSYVKLKRHLEATAAKHQVLILFLIFYYINVQSPNLDLKQGIKPKAGNFLSGKREGEGGGEERLR
jgi:hypothetical protein